MKTFRMLGSSIVMLMMFSCGQNKTDGYVINGKITNPKYDEKTVYMVDAFTGEKYDSTTVSNCRFKFEGKQDMACVRELLVYENPKDIFPVNLPIILENGNINVEMGDLVYVENTEGNDMMMKFLMEKDKFLDGLIEKKLPADSAKKEFSTFIVQQVLKNGNSVVGDYIYKSYKSKLDEKQIEECSKIIK